MNFAYSAYEEILTLLKKKHYDICNYKNYKHSNRVVILRHDVDFSLESAVRFAELENNNNVQSTYFVFLSTGFYNPFYKKANDMIKKIKALGHDIGLHFDEAMYPIMTKEGLIHYVEKEISILSQCLDMEIKLVSMHRPSKWVLEANVVFDTIINSYSKEFFNDFKYLSDSRMHWQEDVHQIIKSNDYERLHILTHPIWYGVKERNMRDHLIDFIGDQKYNCYDCMSDNIKYLDEVLPKTDI